MGRPERRTTSSGYDRRIVIVVEGEDDRRVFSEWLHDVAVDGDVKVDLKALDGCASVIRWVERAQDDPDGPPTYGFLDRDALLNPGALRKDASAALDRFLEPDDGRFRAMHGYCPELVVLERWEVESCVLSGLDSLWEYVRHSTLPRTPPDRDALAVLMLQECQRLVPVCAVVLHLTLCPGDPALPSPFGQPGASRAEVERELQAFLPGRAGEALQSLCPRLDTFEAGATPAERYERLLRIIEGKRLLDWVAVTLTSHRPGRGGLAARRELLGRLSSYQRLHKEVDPIVKRGLDYMISDGLARL